MIQNNKNPLNDKLSGGNMPQNNGGGFNFQNAMNMVKNEMAKNNCKTPQELAIKLAQQNGVDQNQLNQMMGQIQSMFGGKR